MGSVVQLLNAWIKKLLMDRTQKMIVNGYNSSSRKVISGVPQGTFVKLYADDVILYRVISCDADHEILQLDLAASSEWDNTWQMTFNLCS